jgi:hypothetical protein
LAQGFITQQSDRSVSGTSDASLVDDTIYGFVFTCGGSGAQVVNELGFFTSRDSAAGYFKIAIYNVNGSNDPTTLVGATSELQAPASEGWVSATGLSISVTGGSNYALVVWPKFSE